MDKYILGLSEAEDFCYYGAAAFAGACTSYDDADQQGIKGNAPKTTISSDEAATRALPVI